MFLLEDDVIRYANSAAGRIFRMPATGWRDVSLWTRRAARVAARAPSTPDLGATRPSDRRARLRPARPNTARRGRATRRRRARAAARWWSSRTSPSARGVDRVRRDFVANASHELKTPVAGIQLLAESAGNAAADGDVEQSLLFSAQIHAEAVRLERLVRDLLDLSRLETAAPVADSSPTSARRSTTRSSATGRQRRAVDSRSTSTSRRFAASMCSSPPSRRT